MDLLQWYHKIKNWLNKHKFILFGLWVSKWALTFLLIWVGCVDKGDDMPKPKAYHKIDFPAHSYANYNSKDCPFIFEKPAYAVIEKDSLFFNEKLENPCWMDLKFPDYKGVLHLSYKPIENETSFAKYVDDAHKLTFKHTSRAESIDESQINTNNNVGGILYEIGGDAASSVQFFLTDTTNHFIRGALYFNNTPNADSIAPVIKFVKEDMFHLIETFKWQG